MPSMPGVFRPPWNPRALIRKEAQQRSDDRRGSARERGYTSKWDMARGHYLKRHPLCRCCEAQGMPVAATLVDHVQPHKGDMDKFWDSANWQPLCEWCDKNIKRAVENSFLKGQVELSQLHLNYRVRGWVHPACR